MAGFPLPLIRPGTAISDIRHNRHYENWLCTSIYEGLAMQPHPDQMLGVWGGYQQSSRVLGAWQLGQVALPVYAMETIGQGVGMQKRLPAWQQLRLSLCPR